MDRVHGRQHPRTVDDDESIGSGRALVGLVGLVVFVLCFVPDPVQGSWQTIGELLRSILT